MGEDQDTRFAELTFDDFRRLATDTSLSPYEKIGFPDSYRDGYEPAIFADILGKLGPLGRRRQVIVDIGPGCSELPRLIREHCERQEHTLLLVDSEEMLAHHPDGQGIRKFAGQFPDCPELFAEYNGRVDAIIAYSVLHYVYPEYSVDEFLDGALALLDHGGQLLIGDIPNVSKRKRFFASPAGLAFHREFTGSDEPPPTGDGEIGPHQITDAVILDLVARARAAGFDAHLLPQGDELPMANRREDLHASRP